MSVIKTIPLTCPNCKNEFVSSDADGAPTPPRLASKRTDFQMYGADRRSVGYDVHLCGRCGFAGTKRSFTRGEPVSFEVCRHVWDQLMPRVVGASPATSEKYEFAALVAIWNGESAREVADLWLHAAWCCVDEGDTEAERYYRRHAAWTYEESLANHGLVDDADRAVVVYLIGELWRRIGDIARAKVWFDRVAGEITDERSQAWLLRCAKQQQDDPREWFV